MRGHKKSWFIYHPNRSSPSVPQPPSPADIGKKIHALLLQDAIKHQSSNGTIEGSKSPKEELNQLLSIELSQPGLRKNAELLHTLAASLVTVKPDEESRLTAYLKEVLTNSEPLSASLRWIQSDSFLLLLAWCMNYSTPNSQLESFLLNVLVNKTPSLSSEQKSVLIPPLKEALKKLPLSPDRKTQAITTERDGEIVLVYFRTAEIKGEEPIPNSSSIGDPPFGEDPFPSVIANINLALALVDFFWPKATQENALDAKRKNEERLKEAEGFFFRLHSRLSYYLALAEWIRADQEDDHLSLFQTDSSKESPWVRPLNQAYAEGVSLARFGEHLPSLLLLVKEHLERAESVTASHSPFSILRFLFRPSSILTHLPPSLLPLSSSSSSSSSSLFLPYVLPLPLLCSLISKFSYCGLPVEGGPFPSLLPFLFMSLITLTLKAMKMMLDANAEEGQEEEKMLALERGVYSSTLLFDKLNFSAFKLDLASNTSLILSLSKALHLPHSLPVLSSLPPSLSAAIQSSKMSYLGWHFDPTRPLLLSIRARAEIVLHFCFLIVWGFDPMAPLVKGGLLQRIGSVMDGRMEVSDAVRSNVSDLFCTVAEQVKKYKEKCYVTLSFCQDALEEEGAEDSLLLSPPHRGLTEYDLVVRSPGLWY